LNDKALILRSTVLLLIPLRLKPARMRFSLAYILPNPGIDIWKKGVIVLLTKITPLLDFHFKTRELDKEICELIFKLMKDLSVSFYDASYHALSQRMGGIFITADDNYYEKARSTGNIELLGNLRI